MTITATVIKDSVAPGGERLTTMQLRYPRFIHAEFMTHRVFSRNASSSRAIPVERMIEDLRRDPAMPVYWGGHQPGMQAAAELTGTALQCVKLTWLGAMDAAIVRAEVMVANGLHKQIANRILEPWAHINVVVSATSYDNFFELRCHPDAQPEIRVLAEAMRDAMASSSPVHLMPGQWHLPYVEWPEVRDMIRVRADTEREAWGVAKRLSVARCARVSYLTHEGKAPSIQADLALYDRLVGSRPLHASPAEHQATPDVRQVIASTPRMVGWSCPDEHGNFTGWRQLRKRLEKAHSATV